MRDGGRRLPSCPRSAYKWRIDHSTRDARGATDMAGHSQFKNIMHRKGRQDKARSKIFSKLVREITVSVKESGPDPNANPKLRAAIQAARIENMPKDNVERAIRRFCGDGVQLRHLVLPESRDRPVS